MRRLRTILFTLLFALFMLAPVSLTIQESAATAHAATITISNKSATLEVGKTKALKISGTKSKVTWSSGNKSVATVSGSGTVTAKAAGTATITASVSGKKLTCKVTVVKPILISDELLILETGETEKLTVSGTTKTITWTSNNKSVATISSKGTVTAVKKGTATITASVAGKKLTCKVIVENPIKLSSASLTMTIGTSAQLKLTNGAETSIWTSSQKLIATVTNDGTITAYKAVETIIYAYVDGKRLSCKVHVILPENITEQSFAIKMGDNVTVTADGEIEGVIFASGDEGVATIGSDGRITPVSPGLTRITATKDGVEHSYLITIIDTAVNPYITNAPFTPKKLSFGKLSFVTASDWVIGKEEYEGILASYLIQPNSTSESTAYMTIFKSDDRMEYRDMKKDFFSLMTEEFYREQYDLMKKELGLSYKLSGFRQEDYQADFGRAFKTSYTVTIDQETVKQKIYIFSIDKYIVQITATDAGDNKNFSSYIEYMLNSFTLN